MATKRAGRADNNGASTRARVSAAPHRPAACIKRDAQEVCLSRRALACARSGYAAALALRSARANAGCVHSSAQDYQQLRDCLTAHQNMQCASTWWTSALFVARLFETSKNCADYVFRSVVQFSCRKTVTDC